MPDEQAHLFFRFPSDVNGKFWAMWLGEVEESFLTSESLGKAFVVAAQTYTLDDPQFVRMTATMKANEKGQEGFTCEFFLPRQYLIGIIVGDLKKRDLEKDFGFAAKRTGAAKA